MKRTIEWSTAALDDFDSAIEYISDDNPNAADLIADRIMTAIDHLADFPTGHRGRVGGTYEKLVQKTSYIVAYSMSDSRLMVLRIIHGSRDWPEAEWPTE